MTPPTIYIAPELLRAELRKVIEAHRPQRTNGAWESWEALYKEYERRTGVNWRSDAARAVAVTLDYVEDNGGLESLLELAREFLVPRGSV